MRPLRSAAMAAGIVAFTVLAVAAVVFTNSASSRNLVHEAALLHDAQAALGANDVALKALAQAVLLAEDEALGVADATTVAAAVEEAGVAVDELARTVDALAETAVGAGAGAAALDAGSTTLDLLGEGRVAEAGTHLTGPGRDAFVALRDAAGAERAAAAAALESANTLVARTADIARFAVAFLVPLLAVLTYRFIARRQLTLAEVQLDARLTAEQEIGRAKDEFVANISHELRTPLTTIYGFSELLIEQGLLDPDAALDVIGLINVESLELSRMVEDLLTAARAETASINFQIETVPAAEEIDAVIAPLRRTGVAVTVHCPDADVQADRVRVRHILRNLIANARTHGGGDIRVDGVVGAGMLAVTVSDAGSGVPPEMEPRLFTRFVHAADDALLVGSVGLGLAVVRILATGMGGTAEYARRNGRTEFTVRFPLATERRPYAGGPAAVPVPGTLVSAAEALPAEGTIRGPGGG